MTDLLDTSVVSELRKRQPDPRVLALYGGVASADLLISVLTVGEIRLGIIPPAQEGHCAGGIVGIVNHLRTTSGFRAIVIGGHAARASSRWMWDLAVKGRSRFLRRPARLGQLGVLGLCGKTMRIHSTRRHASSAWNVSAQARWRSSV